VFTAIESLMLWYMDTIMTLQPIIVTLITTHIKHATMMNETMEEFLMDDFLTMRIEAPIAKLKIEEMTLEKTTDTIKEETTIDTETIEEKSTETTDDTEETMVT